MFDMFIIESITDLDAMWSFNSMFTLLLVHVLEKEHKLCLMQKGSLTIIFNR
jgi:hypothetical protein